MGVFLALVNSLLDLLFWPLRAADPIYGLAAISFVTGLAMVIVFRFTSNQKAIRQIKDRMQAHLLEVRLFQDQLGVVARAYLAILRWTFAYLRHSLKSLAIILLPTVLLLAQLDLRLSRVPLKPHDSFLLKAKFTQAMALDRVSLRLPEGLALSAPALHIPAEREVDWRIRAEQYGDFAPAVLVAGQEFTKEVVVSDGVARLPAERVRAGIQKWFLHPGEKPLPRDGPLEALEVKYQPRRMEIGPFRAHWLVLFLVFSLLSGFLMKTVLGIEV